MRFDGRMVRRHGDGADFPLQRFQRGFHGVGWWFGWPQVHVGGICCRDMMLVNGSQCPPVLGAFVTVPGDQGADGVGVAELFGQELQAGAGDEYHRPVAGGAEGFQGLVDGGAGQPGAGDQVEAAFRPALGVSEGFVDERAAGRVPGTPAAARAASPPAS